MVADDDWNDASLESKLDQIVLKYQQKIENVDKDSREFLRQFNDDEGIDAMQILNKERGLKIPK